MRSSCSLAPSLTARLSAEDETLGMAWWNAMSKAERNSALAATEAILSRHASPAEAWIVWKNAGLALRDSPARSRKYTHIINCDEGRQTRILIGAGQPG